jgi:hypothetical protein
MSDAKDSKPFDLFESWRGIRDVSIEAWSKAMVDAVNSEAYAQATGTTMDSCLTASAPFREALEKSMVQALKQLGMPTRADILSLAERLTNLEVRLDDMDAALIRIERLVVALAGAPPEGPRRAARKEKPNVRQPKESN